MQINQKYISYCLFLIVNVIGFSTYASTLEIISYAEKPTIVSGLEIVAEDTFYPYEVLYGVSYHVSRRAKLQLSYTRNNQTDLENLYWRYEIDYTEQPSNESGTISVMYNGDREGLYEQLVIFNTNSHISTLSIDAVRGWSSVTYLDPNSLPAPNVTNPFNSTNIPDDILLTLTVETDSYYDFEPSAAIIPLYWNDFLLNEGIEMGWGFCLGAESYDFEWVFIDAHDGLAPSNVADIFNYKEGTRVNTPFHNYTIDPIYPAGTLYFRVRPVAKNMIGHWTYSNAGNSVEIDDSDAFEPDKNWQYNVSFAEDGKSKRVLQYLDGSLRSKQTISKLSTDDIYVVSVDRYDHEGRKSISILPTPIDPDGSDHNYLYKERLNKTADPFNITGAFDKTYFDMNIGESFPAKEISKTSGAGEYYSNDNPFTATNNYDFIPDAFGFPYSQVEFTRDGTGRIERSSGVGMDHRLGSGHETFYYYSEPNNTELRMLFGSNVGNTKHYKKNYTVDANGQISVAYLDQEGRTIATCLVGDSPTNLIALDGISSQTITVSLNPDNYITSGNNIVTRSESSIFNTLPNTYTFSYDLNTGIISTLTDGTTTSCLNCSYKLEIKVLNPDGSLFDLAYPDGLGGTTPEVIHHYTNDVTAVCPDVSYLPTAAAIDFNFSTTALDPIGNYTVIKTLSLDSQAQKTELVNFLSGSSALLPSLTDLQTYYQNQIDYTNCSLLCPEPSNPVCMAFDEVMDGNLGETIINNCETLLEGMKEDVSPGGWLFESPWLEQHLPITIGGTLYITRASMIIGWDDDLADDLVLFHREYCHYDKCVANRTITAFTNQLSTIEDFDIATTSDKINPDPLSSDFNNDPIMDVGHPVITGTQRSDFVYKINTDYDGGKPLSLYVDESNTAMKSVFYPTWGSMTSTEIAERKWQLFYPLYEAERMKVIEAAYAGCVYYGDDYSLYRDPLKSNVGDAYLSLLNDCQDVCLLNVEQWVFEITKACPALTSGDITSIEGYLYDYCTNNCDLINPNAFLIDDYIASDADLIAVKTIIDNASCSGTTILSDIGQPNPCSSTVSASYTLDVPVLTTAADSWELFINDLFNISGLTIGTSYTLNSTNFPNSNALVIAHTSGAAKVKVLADNTIQFLNSSSVVIAENHQFKCLYDNSENLISILDLTGITDLKPSPGYYDGQDATFRFDAIWDNGSSIDYITVNTPGGCPNYYPSVVDLGFSEVFDGDPTITLSTQSISITSCDTWASNSDYDFEIVFADQQDNCEAELLEMANATAQLAYDNALAQLIEDFYAQQNSQCFNSNLVEDFSCSYTNKEYQYTLFYYDQAGSLVQTVPPQGVHPVASSHFPSSGVWDNTEPVHELKTIYQYNSLGQMIASHTPDGGDMRFFYNTKQQLRFSQNDHQEANDEFSYVKYDNLERLVESGVCVLVSDPTSSEIEDNSFPNTSLTEVTVSYYDTPSGHTVPGFSPENLRSRIASVSYRADDVPSLTEYDHATHYSYDIHGNVADLVQDNKKIRFANQQQKEMHYEYDLISGNVNEVVYQEGELDEMRHRYDYDADNRLLNAYSSRDGNLWQKEAEYFYYLHGPLSRVEIGQDKVASSDYAYTIQGWLKGVNSTTVQHNRDIGKDGNNVSTNENRYNARDAYGFSLGYFSGDYQSINSTNFLASNTTVIAPTGQDLYNGNISHMTTAMLDLDENLIDIHGSVYRYDQLQRIKSMDVYLNQSTLLSSNSWTGATQSNVASGVGDYHTEYEYDKNGNLSYLERKTKTTPANGSTHDLDAISYIYGTGELQNRLDHVNDGGDGTDLSFGDIRGSQVSMNYEYDEIGRLTKDVKENIEIDWTATNKVKRIRRSVSVSDPEIEFYYDAMGNRIGKLVKPTTSGVPQGEDTWTYHHYVLDASGNTMAVYEQTYEDLGHSDYECTFILEDVMLYGSTRLGTEHVNEPIYQISINDADYSTYNYFGNSLGGADEELGALIFATETITSNDVNQNVRWAGNKRYELSNHLNNVLAVVTDKKIGVESGTSGILDYYLPDVVTYSDYYPFGMQMKLREGYEPNADYRYGFQGQEKDDEIKGEGNSINYKYRMHDPRLGRFFAVDPLTSKYPHYTPYSFSGNKVIHAIELEGLEEWVVTENNETSDAMKPQAGPLANDYVESNSLEQSERQTWSIGPLLREDDFVYIKDDAAIDPVTGRKECCQAAKMQTAKGGGVTGGSGSRIDTYNSSKGGYLQEGFEKGIEAIDQALEAGVPITVGKWRNLDVHNANPSTTHFFTIIGRSIDDDGNRYYYALDNASKYTGPDFRGEQNTYYLLDWDKGRTNGGAINKPALTRVTITTLPGIPGLVPDQTFEQINTTDGIISEIRPDRKLNK